MDHAEGRRGAGSDRNRREESLTYRDLFGFFLPLAITPFLIASIHTIMNAALARLPYPDLSLAVFNVVKNFTNAIKGPDLMFNQLSVSLIDDRRSFRLVMRFIWSACGFFFGVLFLMGYTPLGGWFLRTVIGLADEQTIRFAYMSMRITCFLPLVETLRNAHQGLAIGREKTSIISMGTMVRLLAIGIFLGWVVHSQAMSGVVAASITWVMGIGVEGLLVFGFIFYYFGTPIRAAEKMPARSGKRVELIDVLGFFLPLALMMILNTSLQPLIQSGIARSPGDATRALAAYGVAWGLVMVAFGPLRMMHHCSLVYVEGDERENWITVQRFCLLVGLIVSLVLLILGLTPLGYLILRHAIAVSEPIAREAHGILLAFAFFPVLRAWREAFWGLLMRERDTRLIGVAKGLNLLTVGVLMLLGVGPLSQFVPLSPGVLGALAFTVGEGFESLVIWHYVTGNVEPVRGISASP